MLEADFLTSLELDDSPVMNHQLDRAVADRLEGLPERVEQRWRQRP